MFVLDRNVHSINELDDILTEALENGIHTDTHKRSYYNIVCAFDIETTSFIERQTVEYHETEVYDYLKGTTIRITQQFYKDIPDFNIMRRDLFGKISFSKNKGISVDSLYKELAELFPSYFNEDDVPNISDQLEHIVEVFNEQRPLKNKTKELKRSVMYVWQLAINGRVIMGRTYQEIVYVFNHIAEFLHTNDDLKLLCYCHNLQMEFAYLRKLFTWNKVFSIDTRKPIYAITDTGIEFRCSYILSNYSLAKLGEQLHKYKIEKLVGDLDYYKLRTPLTPLTPEEIGYCVNDVLVVSAYIQEQIEAERYIYRIPLTCTGYCRRYVRKQCLYGNVYRTWKKQYRKYRALMNSLKITGVEEYELLQRAFQGGFTHTSSFWSGYIVDSSKVGEIDSIDFTSSYPYVALSELMPMSSAQVVDPQTEEEFRYYLKHYCCVFDIRLNGLQPRFQYESYISVSKCWHTENVIENNGRVYSGTVVTTITNIDFEIIEQAYEITGGYEIANFHIYEPGYMPREICTSIANLYAKKTTLKDKPSTPEHDYEHEYQVNKGLLNSVYGMCVTAVCRDEITYTDHWDKEEVNKDKQIEKYNNSRRRFLFYPWGVFITAYARRNLWYGIIEFGEDYIYSDTDSIKCINLKDHMDFVNRYNELCETKLRLMCEHYGLDYEKTLLPKTVDGVEKPLGVYDHDHTYLAFKALRAKAYMTYEYNAKKDKNELSITVSGVNKKCAVPWLLDKYGVAGAFKAFADDLVIPDDYTGKLTHCYIDNETSGVLYDYNGVPYNYNEPSGIYFEKASYHLDMKQDYIDFLKGMFFTK